VYDAPTGVGSGNSSRAVVLPFAFKFFSVNYGNDSTTGGMQLGDNGYITLGYNSTVTSITNASFPGAGLFLGTANRSLLFYGLTTEQTPSNGLMYATAVLRFYSLDAGDDEDQVNLEVTFAKNNVTQFIEIRAGSISYDTAGNGTWGLSDGHQFLVNNTVMPALYSGQSMVLQSDTEGRYWVPHVNSSLDIRAPPGPSVGEGAAQCFRARCLLLYPTIAPPRAAAVGVGAFSRLISSVHAMLCPMPLCPARPSLNHNHPTGALPTSCVGLNTTQAATPLGAAALDCARHLASPACVPALRASRRPRPACCRALLLRALCPMVASP